MQTAELSMWPFEQLRFQPEKTLFHHVHVFKFRFCPLKGEWKVFDLSANIHYAMTNIGFIQYLTEFEQFNPNHSEG